MLTQITPDTRDLPASDFGRQLLERAGCFLRLSGNVSAPQDYRSLREAYQRAVASGTDFTDEFGLNEIIHSLDTAILLCEGLSPDRVMSLAVILSPLYSAGHLTEDEIVRQWGSDVARLLHGLNKVSELYSRRTAVDNANFGKLLLTFAEDIRVIIIMIAERTVVMRSINHHPDTEKVMTVASEARYLYAPLAHRLGLYKMKSELEDMSLKYSNRDIYTRIARKLNETKASRDAYIDSFIAPVKEALERQGLKFDIKGRTKSISSIWNKIQKQHNDLEHIYDLFAIRVILDVAPERERSECWLVYSIITDMYQPNPARLKDWLSIPKSNGYESLHITVMGPGGRWVEVQIRSRRMDEIAEKGVAAHWKYKGIKSENNLDAWMNQVREAMENPQGGPLELMKDFKMDLYQEEVFVFTPRGDLFQLPLGATVLDFAFNIHSKIGCTCTGAKINGRTCRINHKLRSGDTVEIITSSNQTPKADWLNFVVTSKARNKIRQSLNERRQRSAELGKEILQRRFKNRKVEADDATITKVIKKLGFKTATDFYCSIAEESIDPATVMTCLENIDSHQEVAAEVRSAEEFSLQQPTDDDSQANDVLVIGDNIKGVNYRMSKCCNPIYGDKVFGFVSSEGVIKIHREDCPNASNIRLRYPYRVIPVRWSGKNGHQFACTLHVVGHDDIGIVTNISSIINKEKDTSLRSIAIDSHDGLFKGTMTVGVSDIATLGNLIKKIKTVKGVKDVERIL
ncbi:RelA/SpoT family protein [Paramuribaculum intestinale]|jgi:GTP pyrophosphokinase|uniref:RelA/SpoT family protein n=1 Tax=Paramuribaculum intestinale TaxID=2094151 RepID=UPI002729FA68|nr:RelA/SpoT family protein [Paramuribaculum intestinale]